MKAHALRLWGIAASAVVMAVALAVAVQPPRPAQAAQAVAQTEAQAAPVSFLVQFRGGGPIARAQAAAARGETAAAQRQIEAQLLRQTAFAGLCFDRFTLGAAEVVLRSCDSVAANERAAVQSGWLQRLRAMRAVAYADVNTTAAPGRAG